MTVDSLRGHFLRPLGHGTSSEPQCEHVVFAGGGGLIHSEPPVGLVLVTPGQVCCQRWAWAPVTTELSTVRQGNARGGTCPSCPLALAPPCMDPAPCHLPAWPWAAPWRCPPRAGGSLLLVLPDLCWALALPRKPRALSGWLLLQRSAKAT